MGSCWRRDLITAEVSKGSRYDKNALTFSLAMAREIQRENDLRLPKIFKDRNAFKSSLERVVHLKEDDLIAISRRNGRIVEHTPRL